MDTPSFIDFITRLGDERAAEMFRVKQRTIQSWRRAERRPRARDIPIMIEQSGGVLSLASFFEQGRADVA